ncbi:Transcriptional regulator [Streptococcus sp. DD13]|nr:Transcriptional regulator [Streptococcus sp. DD13]
MLRRPTYGNEELLEKKDQVFREIYDDYYDNLPVEEQMAIDAYSSGLDILRTEDAVYGNEIIHRHFYEIYEKEFYTINDLIVIRLFIIWLDTSHQQQTNDVSKNMVYLENLAEKLPKQRDNYDLEEVFVLRDLLINLIIQMGRFQLKLEKLPELFDVVEDIMEESHDLQKKPVLLQLKWTYYLKVKDNYEEAYRCYQDALQLTQLLGDAHLKALLESVWEKDTKKDL